MGASDDITIGYQYYLGMHMILCQEGIEEIQEIRAGDRLVWEAGISSSTTLDINKPDLFGGAKKEGGVVGKVDVMFGDENQGKNAYLTAQLGPDVPGFRGVVSIVLNKAYVTSMSPYVKPWSFKIKSIPSKVFNPTKADIGGSANPMNILYDLITNRRYGMGYDASAIDVTAFTTAADTLFDEGFGLSFVMVSQDSVERMISTIMNHINGVFYTRQDNGQFSVKLIRDDFDANTIPVFNENNIIKLEEYQRPGHAELVNEIVVVFQPQGSSEKDSVVVQDLAGIQVQQGIVSQTFNYIGIDNINIAARVAMRDLRQKSNPVAGLKIIVNRAGFNLNIGDTFKFSWVKLGIQTIIFRIISINYGNFDKGEIAIGALEDVFGMPEASYIKAQPNMWVDPIVDPADLTNMLVRETTYYEVARASTPGDLATYDDTTAFFRAAAPSPPGAHINFELYMERAGGEFTREADSGFCASGLTTTQIDRGVTIITLALGQASGILNAVQIGSYAIINQEMFAVVSMDTGIPGEVILGRAMVDTVPAAHAIGSRVYFFEGNNARTGQQLAPSVEQFKGLAKTSSGTFPLASTTAVSLISEGRFIKPYRPGNFNINGGYFEPVVSGSEVKFGWSHRNKFQETASLLPYINGVINQPGVFYHLKVVGENGSILVNDPNIAGVEVTFDIDNNDGGEISSGTNRDAVVSGYAEVTPMGPALTALTDRLHFSPPLTVDNETPTFAVDYLSDQAGGLIMVGNNAKDYAIDYVSPTGVKVQFEKTGAQWLTDTQYPNGRGIPTQLLLAIDTSTGRLGVGWTRYVGTGDPNIDSSVDVQNKLVANGDGVPRNWTMFIGHKRAKLEWWANDQSNSREIFRFTHTTHTISNLDIAAGNYNNARAPLYNYNVAREEQFDSVIGAFMGLPGGFEYLGLGNVFKAEVLGNVVYAYFRGGVGTVETTAGKLVDVTTDLFDSHINYYKQIEVVTARCRVDGNGIVIQVIDVREGLHFGCRTSAGGGINGWEKTDSSIRTVDLQTGALGPLIANTYPARTVIGDKEAGLFYMTNGTTTIEQYDGATGNLLRTVNIDPPVTSLPTEPVIRQTFLLGANHLFLVSTGLIDESIIQVPLGADMKNGLVFQPKLTSVFNEDSQFTANIAGNDTSFDMGVKTLYKSDQLLYRANFRWVGASPPADNISRKVTKLIRPDAFEVVLFPDTPRMSDEYTIELDSVLQLSPTEISKSYQTTEQSIDHAGWGLRYGEYYGGS